MMYNYLKKYFLNNDLLKYSFITFVIKISGLLLSFLFMHYIIYKFDIILWGDYVLFEKTLLVLTMFSSLGLSTASVKLVSKYYATNQIDKIRSLYLNVFLIGVVFCFIVILLFNYFEPSIKLFLTTYISKDFIYYDDYIKIFKFVLLCLVPSVMLLIHSDFLRSINSHKFFSIINKNNFILPFVFLLVLAFKYSALTIVELLSLYFYSLLIFFSASFIYLARTLKLYKLKLVNLTSSAFFKILKLSIPMVFAGFSLILLQWVDVIFIFLFENNANVGENALGQYGVIVKYASATTIILYSINSIASTKISKYFHSQDITLFKQTIIKSTRMIFFSTIPIFILMFIFSNYIDLIDPNLDDNVKYTFKILIISNALNSLCGPVGQILLMTGKEKTFQNIVFCALIINIALNLFFIPIYGIVGAGYATLVSVGFWNFISVYFVYKYHNISTFYYPGKSSEV